MDGEENWFYTSLGQKPLRSAWDLKMIMYLSVEEALISMILSQWYVKVCLDISLCRLVWTGSRLEPSSEVQLFSRDTWFITVQVIQGHLIDKSFIKFV